jgi:methyltransferase (TIGR00027 family)
MARTADDTWGVGESVGATAVGAAEWRVRETNREDPLIIDPYAQLFLDAVAARGIPNWEFNDELMARLQATDPHIVRGVRAQQDFVASRTKWFDEFFTGASAAGIRQAVILATGLDARAWRLPWPDDAVVYEIDQPQVLEFKDETLRSHGAEPTVRRKAVPIDLRLDWPKALRDAGFDPGQPTAWSVEGLLAYLPASAQELLLGRLHSLSTPGSRIATDALNAAFFRPDNLARLGGWFNQIREVMIRNGGDLPDTPNLWFDDERTELADWLHEHGWRADAVEVHDLMARYQRGVPDEDAAGIPQCVLVEGRLP